MREATIPHERENRLEQKSDTAAMTRGQQYVCCPRYYEHAARDNDERRCLGASIRHSGAKVDCESSIWRACYIYHHGSYRLMIKSKDVLYFTQ